MTNQSYTYTLFGKASLILETREYSPDGTPLASPQTISSRRIIYGPDHQRWQTVLTDSAGVVTTISYQPGCETVQRGSVKTSNFYLEADGETVAILKNTSNYIDLYYVETDHLGSITGLVNTSGTEIYSAEFDAWGKRTVTHSGTGGNHPGIPADKFFGQQLHAAARLHRTRALHGMRSDKHERTHVRPADGPFPEP